jgi:predicted RNase H-like HicB family nuclease
MHTAMRHFPVLIEMDEDGVYIVSCPLFEGCHSYGATIEAAMQNLTEVIEMCLEEQRETSFQPVNQFIGIRDLAVA